MKLVRPLVAVASLGALVALAIPSQAATPAYKGKTLVLTDDEGDGNGLNGQGLATGLSVPATGNPGFDIVKLEYKGLGTMVKKGRVFLPKCTGFQVALTFAGAPTAQTIIRVTGNGVTNDAGWWLQLEGTASTIRYIVSDPASATGTTSTTIPTSVPAKVEGGKITWTITEKDVKATGEVLQKLALSEVGASVRTTTGVVTAPQWDELVAEGQSFKAC